MNHKVLLTCLGLAMSCGVATLPAQAAGPGSGLTGLHATDGSSLVQTATYGHRRRHWNWWWHSRRWDDDFGWHRRWWHHRRDHDDYRDHRRSRRHGEHRRDRRDSYDSY